MKNATLTRPESFFLSDPADMNLESASEYVRSFLAQRLRIELFDENRPIVGTFVALDTSGGLFLRECVVRSPIGETRLTTLSIRTNSIQHIELVIRRLSWLFAWNKRKTALIPAGKQM
jgi:hypothetical protein